MNCQIEHFNWACDMSPALYEGIKIHPPESGVAWTLRIGHLNFWCWRVKPEGRHSFYRIDNDKTSISTRPSRMHFLQRLMNHLPKTSPLSGDERQRLKDVFSKGLEQGGKD